MDKPAAELLTVMLNQLALQDIGLIQMQKWHRPPDKSLSWAIDWLYTMHPDIVTTFFGRGNTKSVKEPTAEQKVEALHLICQVVITFDGISIIDLEGVCKYAKDAKADDIVAWIEKENILVYRAYFHKDNKGMN
jgi:hypothetical protein